MQDVLALVGAVSGVIADLLQQDFDEVQDHLSSNHVFCKASTFGIFDGLAGLLT